MDDTRVDLSQLEDPGTGRSVPTTPLQVSPQGIYPIILLSECDFDQWSMHCSLIFT